MLHLYATKKHKALRDMKAFCTEWGIPYKVILWNNEESVFWDEDTLDSILDGLSMTQDSIPKGDLISLVVSPRNKVAQGMVLEGLPRKEQLALLDENRGALRGLISYDPKKEIAVSGYDLDGIRVFLPREVRKKIREGYLAKAESYDKVNKTREEEES